MLIIRFQRVGRKNDPAYRIVVTEKQNAAQKKHLEILGSYHPKTKDTRVKGERVKYWISKGAQVSDTAYNLFVKEKILEGKARPVVRARAKALEASKEAEPVAAE